MSEQIDYQDEEIPPLEGIIQSPSQMQRLFKTRDAALDFAKFMREGDVLIRGGMIDGIKKLECIMENDSNES